MYYSITMFLSSYRGLLRIANKVLLLRGKRRAGPVFLGFSRVAYLLLLSKA